MAIPFAFSDDLELVDYLGRAIHPHRRGVISSIKPELFTRLGIDTESFIAYSETFLSRFGTAVEIPDSLTRFAVSRQNRYLRGMSTARAVFGQDKVGLAA